MNKICYGILIAMPLLLSGCYESPDVTFHEPGVYKGKIDKHELSQDERNEVLRKRIMAVQTDR